MANLIEIVVSGRNEAKTALADARKDGEGLASSMSKMGVVAGAALVGIGVEAVKMATTYETSTTRLVTSAGESTKNIDLVRKGMLNMAGQVGISANDLAKGMYTVESAGYHGADGLTVLKSAAQGAKDENADLAKVANAVTDVLVDYHLKASDAADVTSQMVTAVSFGKTTFDDFSGSMHNILPLASAMHLSFADVSGVLAEMTAHGMSADQASQNMANAMRSLIAPTKAQTTEFTKLGISAEDVRTHLSTVGLAGTMQFLADTAKKVGPNVLEQEAALKKLMGTAPGLSVALMTTGENFDATTQAIKGISGASADAQGNVKGFSEIQQTLGQRVAEAKASFDSLMITLGDKFIPILKDTMDWMNKNHDVVVLIAESVATLTAGLAAYAIASKVAAAATVLWSLAQWDLDAAMDANPLGAIILLLVALGAALYELFSHWTAVWNFVKKSAEEVWKFLGKVWDDIRKDAVKLWDNVKKDAETAWGRIVGVVKDAWGHLVDAWNDTGGKVVTAIANAWSEVAAAVSEEWDHIVSDLSSIWNNLVELWNDTGGKIAIGAKGAMDFLYNSVLKPQWEFISRLFMDNLKIIEGFVRAWVDTTKALVKIAWDLISGTIKTAWDLISGYVVAGVDFIDGILKAAWAAILGGVHIAWDLIKAGINIPLDLLRGTFQLFTDFVTGHWSKLWGDVKKIASDLWNNIYAVISGVLGTIKNTAVSSASDIINGFIAGVGKALGGVRKAFGDVASTVSSVFRDAIHWLEQAGRDLIQGLINGIGSMAGNLGGALGSIASKVGNALNPVSWFAQGGEVGHAAVGGPRSGMVMVGEHGPELVRLPTGSTVRSNPDTMADLAGGRGGGGVAQLVWVGPEGDELFTLIKRWIRVNYGNDPGSVQKALGQTF